MPKQHHPNNELTDGGANHLSSNDAWPHDTPRTDDDVILLTPINQNQPTVAKTKQSTGTKPKPPVAAKTKPPVAAKTKPPVAAKPKPPVAAKTKPPVATKPKQPAVAKTKQPTVSKPKPPAVKKQNANSNGYYKAVVRQQKRFTRFASSPFHRFRRKKEEPIPWPDVFREWMKFFGVLIFGVLIFLGLLWVTNSKTSSQKAFQKEWNKLQQKEAAGITPEIYKPNKEKPKAEKAVGEEKKRKTEKTAAVDSAESTTDQAVESTTGDVVESSSEDSETEDDNDDLVMDFLKRKVGTVSGKPSPQRTRQIRRPPNPVLQQYMPRGSWSPGNLSRHWAKHGHEFPEYGSEAEYGRGALYFFEHPPPGTLRKTRGNGDCLFYHPRTNTFGVTTADGTPKTMFKPDSGMDYWNRQ